MTDPTASKLLEQLSDAWCNAIQSDLENGVKCLNDKAAADFHARYPAISAFGEMLNDLYLDTCND
jgi:hypothetical protein